ncbi:FAS1-like dehydratase domain-containing protein [Jatrophihabitans sp. DSM 45814]
MPESNISEAMRNAIGTEVGRRVSYPISESDIRRWAIAVYYPEAPPEEYIDPVAAEKSQYGGIVAPQEFNPFAWLAAEERKAKVEVTGNDPDRSEKVLGIPGPGLKFMLNGGLEVEYGVPMRPGDVITSVSRLADYREAEGRLGLMLFTVTEDAWTNQKDEVVKRTRGTLIRY